MPWSAYVASVLENYQALPDTPNRSSRSDRALAQHWFQQQILLEQIHAAFSLALLRCQLRPPRAPRLPQIRSLYYFAPLLEELSQPTRYLQYCRFKAARLFPTIPFLQQ
jgi:hypothetical protein